MKRGQPLQRHTPLRAKGGSRFPHRRSREYVAWIRTLPCLVPNCTAYPSECAHVHSRGAGGDDIGNTVPLCTGHHAEQHSTGIVTFSDRYHLNLTYRAAKLATLYHPKGDT